MTQIFTTPEGTRLEFDIHKTFESIYGPRVYGRGMHHAATKRMPHSVWHLIITLGGWLAPIKEDLEFDGYIHEAVARSHQSCPEVRIHVWAYWPNRLELLIDGPRHLHNRVLGRIKSGLTRRLRAETSSPIHWDNPWGVPITSPSQRLVCLNHLRARMNALQSRDPEPQDQDTADQEGQALPGLRLV